MKQPISHTTLFRFQLAVIVLLAFASAYFHSLYQLERKRYNRLEDMFVRVRAELGREETQRLIDLSYQQSEVE